MITNSSWPLIANDVVIYIARPIVKPRLDRYTFRGSGGGYLFIAQFDCIPDTSNDITRTLEIHFHTDSAIKKAGEISVQWAKEEDFDNGNQKHRLKKGPDNRPLDNLSSVDFRSDKNTGKVADYLVSRIKKDDYSVR